MNRSDAGRAVISVYLGAREQHLGLAAPTLGSIVKAGRAIDFSSRIQRRGSDLSSTQVRSFAATVGLDETDLVSWALPALKQAGVLEYSIREGHVHSLEEYVGVTAPLLEQADATFKALAPPRSAECALESAALAAHSPLTLSDHNGALEAMGFERADRESALSALDSVGLLERVTTEVLRDPIVYNHHIWGNRAPQVAAFLTALDPEARDSLIDLARKTQTAPGVPISRLGAISPDALRAAQKVGFIDTASVVSRSRTSETFAFSPVLEQQLAARQSTDALHERKLFVAHILFGHYNAPMGTGRIANPLVLVRALLSKGEVGPATAIGSDYPLLESHGIVRVLESKAHPGRSYLRLMKEDVVRDGLDLLQAALGESETDGLANEDPLAALWLPNSFQGPEDRRRALRGPRLGPAGEMLDETIKNLRATAGRSARGEDL